MYRDTQKYLNALWPIEGNFLKSILIWLLRIIFNEIYMRYSDAQLNSLLRKWVYIAESAPAQRHTEVFPYITAYVREIL